MPTAPSAKGRWPAPVFLIAAFLGALVAWIASAQEPAPPPVLDHPSVQGEARPPRLIGGGGELRTSREMPEKVTPPAQIVGAREVRVLVLAGETQQPVAAAQVALVRRTAAMQAFGVVRASELVATAPTESDGRCSLAAPESSDPLLVIARHHKHGSTFEPLRLEAGVQDIVLRLPSAVRVAGEVHDSEGKPVAGLSVVARHIESDTRGRQGGVWDVNGREVRTASTDASGRFTLHLAAGETYWFVASGDGWLAEPLPTRTPFGQKVSIPEGGIDGVRLQVWPCKAFILQLVNAKTSKEVRLRAPVHVQALKDAGILSSDVVPFTLPIGSDRVQFSPTLGTGILRGVVGVQADAQPQSADIFIDLPGFSGTRVKAKLVTPSEARDKARAQKVWMHPNTSLESGTVHVTLTRAYERHLTSDVPELWVDREGLRALKIPATDWKRDAQTLVFEDVPAGDLRVLVDDGIGQSVRRPLRLAPGETAMIDARIELVCGIALRARARGSRQGPLLDVHVVGRYQGSPVATMRTNAKGQSRTFNLGLDRWVPQRVPDAVPLRLEAPDRHWWFYRFPAGTYELTVSSPGFQPQVLDVDVKPGNVPHIDLWLPRAK